MWWTNQRTCGNVPSSGGITLIGVTVLRSDQHAPLVPSRISCMLGSRTILNEAVCQVVDYTAPKCQGNALLCRGEDEKTMKYTACITLRAVVVH